MRTPLYFLTQLALILLAAGVVQGQTHPDGFFLNSPLSLSSGYDSHFIAGSQALDDSVTLITGPTAAWLTSTHRTDFSLDYQPEIELFAQHPGFDAWNHVSTLRLSHRINSRWSLHVGDHFLSTMDPTRTLDNSLVLLPRGRFNQNTVFGDLVYRVNGTTKITFRFDNALTEVSLPQLQNRLNNVTTAGTATIDRILSSRHQLTASYSFLHVTPLGSAASGNATNVNLLILGYTFAVNPELLIRVSGGYVAGAESAFNGSAAIEKKFGGVWTAAGYQRYLGFFGGFTPVGGVAAGPPAFATGLTPNSVYQVFSLRAFGKVNRHIGLAAELQKALSGVDASGQGVRSLIVQSKVDYTVNGRLSLFAQVDHYAQNINPFFDQSLSRNRYFGGLEITLMRPQEADRGGYRHGKAPQESQPVQPPEDTTEAATEEK